MCFAISRLYMVAIKLAAFHDASFSTRDPSEATNLDRQLYNSDGDARLILGVLILPLFFSTIFFKAAILENSFVSGDLARPSQIVSYGTSETRELFADLRRRSFHKTI